MPQTPEQAQLCADLRKLAADLSRFFRWEAPIPPTINPRSVRGMLTKAAEEIERLTQ
jgi:hypothetical protein